MKRGCRLATKNIAGQTRLAHKMQIEQARPLTEHAALTQFIETWRRSHPLMPLAESDKIALIAIVAKCQQRLQQMDKERRELITRAEELGKEYEAYRETQIQAGHKVSGYSNWVKKAPGSYGQPKK